MMSSLFACLYYFPQSVGKSHSYTTKFIGQANTCSQNIEASADEVFSSKMLIN